ncbi:MAG: hypothetical protein ACLFP6_12540 [Spirochaetaceae bacterium]
MWRLAVSLALLALLVPTLSAQEGRGRSAPCEVPRNYLEALGENQRTLLGIVYMANSAESALDGREGGIAYYNMLASTRRYHLDLHNGLNSCAQELNLATINTLSAAADMVVMVIARRQEPESGWAAVRAAAAVDELNDAFNELLARTERTVLVVR